MVREIDPMRSEHRYIEEYIVSDDDRITDIVSYLFSDIVPPNTSSEHRVSDPGDHPYFLRETHTWIYEHSSLIHIFRSIPISDFLDLKSDGSDLDNSVFLRIESGGLEVECDEGEWFCVQV